MLYAFIWYNSRNEAIKFSQKEEIMKLKVSKKQIVLCVAIVIVAALIATILLVGNPANLFRDKVVSSDTYTDDVNYGDVSSVFQDQIESYLASYLEQANSLGYVT